METKIGGKKAPWNLPSLVKVAPPRFKEKVGKKKRGRKTRNIIRALGFGGRRRVLGAQPPALCPLTKAARAEQKCSCAQPDSWAREGDHLPDKIISIQQPFN